METPTPPIGEQIQTVHYSRVRQLVLAIILSSLVAGIGSLLWGALIVANFTTIPSIPWAVPVMGLILYGYWKYFGGKGPPHSTSTARHNLLRARIVPRQQFIWSLIAGLSSIIALAGFWILMVRLGSPGGNPTLNAVSNYPLVTIVPFIVMGSLVSPITEEAAFRGYAQTELERAYPAIVAVGISSFLFMLWHGPTQGFIFGKLVFYFIVGLVFGTIAYFNNSTLPALPVHITGDLVFFILIWPFDMTQPLISITGIDLAFLSMLILTLVAAGFSVWAYTRLRSASTIRAVPNINH